MVNDLVSSIAQASWLPSCFLVAAMICFAAVVIWVIRLDKRVVSEIERLPLDSSDVVEQQGGNTRV